MTSQHRFSESFRSIAGGALVGLALHILSGNLGRAAAQFRHLLGATAGETPGMPSVVLAASQAAQAYASDHQVFLVGLLRVLVSFWPLLLVIVGTVLLQDALADKVKALPATAKYFQNRDTGCRFRFPAFDVSMFDAR
jgi:hypothetical protein